jgi:ubiquitin-like domain-containing CTD phosphatase 1
VSPQQQAGGAADAATAAPTASAADTVELAVKWQKQDITIHVEPSESVQGIKRKLEAATSVSEKRMKLLGLKVRSGKPAADADVVADLMLKPGSKIMMMGTAEADIERLNKDAEVAPHVQDDFDIQEEGMAEMAELKDRPEVQEKLARRITSCNVKVLNPPRPGKKLLVADIDYTSQLEWACGGAGLGAWSTAVELAGARHGLLALGCSCLLVLRCSTAMLTGTLPACPTASTQSLT